MQADDRPIFVHTCALKTEYTSQKGRAAARQQWNACCPDDGVEALGSASLAGETDLPDTASW